MANETVLFKRGDSATITSTPVTDGQILFDTSGNGKMYLDNGTDRLEMGGAITVDASLSKTSTNAIQNKAVTGNILNSLAEVSAATQQNTIAGALALKEVNSSLNNLSIYADMNNVIQDMESSGTYNITEDGIVIGYLSIANTSIHYTANVKLDGVIVSVVATSGGSTESDSSFVYLPVKAGQVITVTKSHETEIATKIKQYGFLK